jgi:hypothetical protein
MSRAAKLISIRERAAGARALLRDLEAKEIYCRQLKVEVASHSSPTVRPALHFARISETEFDVRPDSQADLELVFTEVPRRREFPRPLCISELSIM